MNAGHLQSILIIIYTAFEDRINSIHGRNINVKPNLIYGDIMKTSVQWLLTMLCCVLLLSGTTFSQGAGKKMTVAVLEFQAEGTLTANEAYTVSQRFRAELVQTQAFQVLEREKMNDILKEQDFSLSDNCNTSECVVQVGRLLGVEFMFAGSIGKLGETYAIDIRMISVETGTVNQTLSRNYSGKIDGLLDEMRFVAISLSGIDSKKKSMKESEKITQSNTNKKPGGPSNAFLSVIFPGLGGYFVEKNKIRPILTTVSAAGLIGFGLLKKSKSSDYYSDYKTKRTNSLYKKANDAHHTYYIATRVGAVIWLADIIYVAYKGSQNVKQAQSASLNMPYSGLRLDFTDNQWQIGYSVSF